MFGPKGNPQASNLFSGIHYLQEQEGIHLVGKTLFVSGHFAASPEFVYATADV